MKQPADSPVLTRQITAGKGLLFAGSGASLGGLAGLPWQAIVGVSLILAIGATLLGVVNIVVPQESSDRVLWARDRLRHKVDLQLLRQEKMVHHQPLEAVTYNCSALQEDRNTVEHDFVHSHYRQ